MSLASYQAAPPRSGSIAWKSTNLQIPSQKYTLIHASQEAFLLDFFACTPYQNPYNASTMAHKKAGGSTANGRDSRAKRRGVKRYGGQVVASGEVLIRQKGFWYRPGLHTHIGSDWTIHADTAGVVRFSQQRITKFNGRHERATVIHIEPVATKA
ncbi:MAG: 50S ribosomal protein L27 [Candidatus Peregrinibacteria bacterium Greene0416_62]|nr:MAG: 50S ribosomal protein L27 [Candidatus Peregrinibacteria bacterium Greene0416_62]